MMVCLRNWLSNRPQTPSTENEEYVEGMLSSLDFNVLANVQSDSTQLADVPYPVVEQGSKEEAVLNEYGGKDRFGNYMPKIVEKGTATTHSSASSLSSEQTYQELRLIWEIGRHVLEHLYANGEKWAGDKKMKKAFPLWVDQKALGKNTPLPPWDEYIWVLHWSLGITPVPDVWSQPLQSLNIMDVLTKAEKGGDDAKDGPFSKGELRQALKLMWSQALYQWDKDTNYSTADYLTVGLSDWFEKAKPYQNPLDVFHPRYLKKQLCYLYTCSSCQEGQSACDLTEEVLANEKLKNVISSPNKESLSQTSCDPSSLYETENTHQLWQCRSSCSEEENCTVQYQFVGKRLSPTGWINNRISTWLQYRQEARESGDLAAEAMLEKKKIYADLQNILIENDLPIDQAWWDSFELTNQKDRQLLLNILRTQKKNDIDETETLLTVIQKKHHVKSADGFVEAKKKIDDIEKLLLAFAVPESDVIQLSFSDVESIPKSEIEKEMKTRIADEKEKRKKIEEAMKQTIEDVPAPEKINLGCPHFSDFINYVESDLRAKKMANDLGILDQYQTLMQEGRKFDYYYHPY